MAKIHITLVGGQPSPVYWGIKHSKPDVVVLVYSKESVAEKETIKRVMKLNEHKCLIQECCFDAVNLLATKNESRKLLDKFTNDEVEINIASGTKMWAYYFIESAKNMRNVFFVNVDQNCKFYNYTKSEESEIDFTMKEELYLHARYGYDRIEWDDLNEDDLREAHAVENLRRFGGDVFTKLVEKINFTFENYRIRNGDDLVSLHNILPPLIKAEYGQSYIKWNKKEEQFTIHIDKNNRIKEVELSSPYAFEILLSGRWFEFIVAELIKKIFTPSEIILSCEFKGANKETLNEIDVIANIGNKLLFVECKTHLQKGIDIDKFASSARNYGGNGTVKLFISYDGLPESAITKCKNNKMLFFSCRKCNDPIKELERYLLNNINRSRL